MNAKRIVGVALAAMVLLSAVAMEASAVTTIRWTAWGNIRRVENLYKVIIGYFEAAKPDIKVTYEPYPETEKILAMFAAGTAPDIILCDWNIAQTYGGAGRALPLDPLIKRDKFDLGRIYEVALDSYRTKGVLYAMPFKIDVHMLVINKDLFDKAGVKSPENTPWNWAQLREAAIKLTDAGKKQFGFSWYESGYDAYSAWPWMNGGSMIVKEGDKIKYTFNDPNTVEAFQFLADLVHKDKAMLSPSQATATAMGMGGEQYFMTGKVGFMMSGDWHMSAYTQIKDFNWDLAVMPYQKVRAVELGGIANLINAGSKYKDEAWEFLKFMTTEKAQKRLLETMEGLPMIKGMPAYDLPGKNAKALTDVIPYLKFEPHFPEWAQSSEEIEYPLLDQLWMGKKTAQEVCDEITQKGNAFLKKVGRQ
ncbi:MAG: ABC transporter substrate-binding protein [bacterium]